MDLAQMAGISRTTLQRIEAGQEVKPDTLSKIAACLRVIEWDFLAPVDVWNRPYRVSRNEKPEWLVTFNRAGSPCHYPDGTPVPKVSDKDRLGRLGFVSAFVSRLHCDLLTGRLHAALVEIYGDDEKGPYRHPEEEFVYVLRGHVRIRVGEEKVDLKEGQSMTFFPTELHSYGLPRPLRRDQEAPLVLMVWTSEPKPSPSTSTGKRRRKPRSVKPAKPS